MKGGLQPKTCVAIGFVIILLAFPVGFALGGNAGGIMGLTGFAVCVVGRMASAS